MMANSDFVSIFPDPDRVEFDDPGTLPEGVSAQDLRYAREQYRRHFHPTVANSERFDRRDLPSRLPFADGPSLPSGPDGREPVVTVVGHDFERFARDGLEVCNVGVVSPLSLLCSALLHVCMHNRGKGCGY
jgi:hypothetical protein